MNLKRLPSEFWSFSIPTSAILMQDLLADGKYKSRFNPPRDHCRWRNFGFNVPAIAKKNKISMSKNISDLVHRSGFTSGLRRVTFGISSILVPNALETLCTVFDRTGLINLSRQWACDGCRGYQHFSPSSTPRRECYHQWTRLGDTQQVFTYPSQVHIACTLC
jgi:hypothetical protein